MPRSDTKREIRHGQLAWVREVLRVTGESPSALAANAGLADNVLSRFLGEKYQGTLSPLTVRLISEYTQLPGPDAAAASGRSLGLGEGAQLDLKGMERNEPALAGAVKALLAGRNNATAWVLDTRAIEGLGYQRGDVVIVDLNERPRAGDPVCAQLYDLRRGTAETIFRVYEPPYLVASSFDPTARKPLLEDNERVIVKGVVTDMVRRRASR